MPKPKGSGVFALAAGGIFLGAFVSSFILDLSRLSPYVAFQVWLVFAVAILLGWGAGRTWTGGTGDWRVGQPTINFVVGVVGATLALLALVMQ